VALQMNPAELQRHANWAVKRVEDRIRIPLEKRLKRAARFIRSLRSTVTLERRRNRICVDAAEAVYLQAKEAGASKQALYYLALVRYQIKRADPTNEEA